MCEFIQDKEQIGSSFSTAFAHGFSKINLDQRRAIIAIGRMHGSLFSDACCEWQIIILLMQSGFNPEQTANDIRAKSFLKSRDPQRDTSGSIFFRDNKIRSCSYIKETPGALKAVPFYDKRDNTLYPTPSNVKQSWNANTYGKPNTIYAGMGSSKPLHAYDPKEDRNNLNIRDFRPPYPNSSKIEIGQRSNRDVKHYTTNYGNSFITKPGYVPTSHPGIEAFRNKWVRSRLAK